MIRFFQNLETSIKLVIFFSTIIIALFGFVINSYIKITQSLATIQNSQKEIEELNKYKDITIGAFIDKQYEKILKGDLEDLKEADIQLLTLYSQNLKLDIEITYKINKVLSERGDVK